MTSELRKWRQVTEHDREGDRHNLGAHIWSGENGTVKKMHCSVIIVAGSIWCPPRGTNQSFLK